MVGRYEEHLDRLGNDGDRVGIHECPVTTRRVTGYAVSTVRVKHASEKENHCAYDSALDDEGERRYSDKGKLSRSVWWSVLRVWPPILSCFVLCRVVKRSGH